MHLRYINKILIRDIFANVKKRKHISRRREISVGYIVNCADDDLLLPSDFKLHLLSVDQVIGSLDRNRRYISSRQSRQMRSNAGWHLSVDHRLRTTLFQTETKGKCELRSPATVGTKIASQEVLACSCIMLRQRQTGISLRLSFSRLFQ